MLGELVQVIYFKCEMCQIRTDDDRPAVVKFANLNFLMAAGRFQENQLRAAPGSVTPKLLQTEHVLVERNCFLQIVTR